MYENDKRSPLDRLKKALYSRREDLSREVRHDIHESDRNVPESWESPGGEVPVSVSPKQRRMYRHFFAFSVAFLGLAMLVGGFTFLGGKNFVSVDNIDILIEGPATTPGGEALSLNASILNKNATDIELVDLIVEFPDGSKDPASPEKDAGRQRYSIGDIRARGVAQKSVSAIMFGEEGEVKEIKFTAEYRTADSNAIFYKEKTYVASISSSPVLISIEAYDKVLGGQPTNISVVLTSNAKSTLKNLLLSMDLPFGSKILSSNPSPTYGGNIWRLGDLAPGAKKTVKLQVTTQGQDGEERTVKAVVGIQSQTNERQIATPIISRSHTFRLEKPFLGLDLTLDGDRGDLATVAGRSVKGEILWVNNSANKITGARIEAKLSGAVLDKSSVSVTDGGYYDSLTNTIIWEAGRSPGLDSIAPGDDGRIGFGFRSLSAAQTFSNPSISISVSATGDRIDESGAPSAIESGTSRTVKLVSNLALSARAYHSGAPFQNDGPMPPKVEQTTTYTVAWTVTNTSNVVTATRITASLPAYAKWTGKVSPEDAAITYNPTGGVITWLPGDIPRNAEVGSGAKQVYFQIALTPSVGQEGQAPEILSNSSIFGIDTFTGANIQNSAQSLTTRISTDLLWKQGNEIVQQ